MAKKVVLKKRETKPPDPPALVIRYTNSRLTSPRGYQFVEIPFDSIVEIVVHGIIYRVEPHLSGILVTKSGGSERMSIEPVVANRVDIA